MKRCLHPKRSWPALADDAMVERASRLFRALGDKPRLSTLALLAQGEVCVSEIARFQNESLTTVSQRLRVLRAENLVVRRRNGKHMSYSLTDRHVADLVLNALAHAGEPSLTRNTSKESHHADRSSDS
jgi:ArsR family transcriptional regulator, lead/cadmium/zinc/bismuth-responsive transcriptional repressor